MPDIRAVTLDLWQTLIIDRPELGRERMKYRIQGVLEALEDAGELFTEEQVTDAYRACYRTCHAIREKERDISFTEQVGIFVRGIDEGLPERIGQETFASIESSYADSFYEMPAPLADGVPEMLAELKERGYRLGLISNTGMTPGWVFRVYLESLGLIGYFDQLTFSDEVLLSKPSLAMFLLTLKSLGYPAHQAVHVGDHLRLDIRGGQRAGMRTVWVEGFDTEKTDIVAETTIRRIAELPQALGRLAS